MEINLWIRAARKKCDLTQEELGKVFGLSKANVSAWETGKHKPSFEQIQKIAALAMLPMPGAEDVPVVESTYGKRIGSRVAQVLEEVGISAEAFATRLSVPEARVLGWLDGDSASVDDAVTIQTEFGYSMAWILAGVGPYKIPQLPVEDPEPDPAEDPRASTAFSYEYNPQPIEKWRRIPVVGMAQLGDNGYFVDIEYPVGQGDGYVDWPTSDPDAYALECAGLSMYPRVKPGEFVVVEPNQRIDRGDEVLVKSKDGRVMVKEFLYKADGRCHLSSVNAAYGRFSIPIDEIEKMHYVGGFAKRSKRRLG